MIDLALSVSAVCPLLFDLCLEREYRTIPAPCKFGIPLLCSGSDAFYDLEIHKMSSGRGSVTGLAAVLPCAVLSKLCA